MTPSASRKERPATRRLPGAADTSCLAGPVTSSLPVQPLIDNPSACGGAA